MKLTPALRREWSTKLRASGFQDIEGPGGLLSNRGMPTAFADPAHHMRPEARAEAEEAHDAEVSALHGFRFATNADRELWRVHCESPLRETAKRLGISYRQAWQERDRIATAIKERTRREVNSVNSVNHLARRKIDAWARKMDVRLLAALVGGLT